MEVPFLTSGAMSRAHYALVRKIETAPSPAAVDHIVLAEIEVVRNRLQHGSLTQKQTKESLILLLYCTMLLHDMPDVNLDFALPHAVNMAEAGHTVQFKRIGYVYCAEMMHQDHELQLMLVNTLRKDLESLEIPRICLALESLILSPSEDVIPAIQDRLHDLLSHNSAHVRKRALLAFQALSLQSGDILHHVVDKMKQRLRDTDTSVAIASLAVCITLAENGMVAKDKLQLLLHKLLQDALPRHNDPSKRCLAINILKTLRALRQPSREIVDLLLNALSSGRYLPNSMVLECFLLFDVAETDVLLQTQQQSKYKFVGSIRSLLLSQSINDIYLFMTCLTYLDPVLWAGTKTDIPIVLEDWEVERIMSFLESPDTTIRKKTLQVLGKVDKAIVEAYLTRLLQVDRSAYTVQDVDEVSRRLLEIIDALSANDGESYAHHVKVLMNALQDNIEPHKNHLFESVVEDVLVHVRIGDAQFRSECLGVLFTLFDDTSSMNGPTATVILSALACEFMDNSLLPPAHLLQGLASRLSSSSPAIQDALLLTMLRISLGCETVPESIHNTVRKIQEGAGRHIKRRCEQFITLSTQRTTLQNILGDAKSTSLPDFMLALESSSSYANTSLPLSPPQIFVSPERSSSRASSNASQSGPKLRYTAYDVPKPTPGLRRFASNSSIARSDSSRFVGQEPEPEDPLSRTITAGDLTLAIGKLQVSGRPKASPSSNRLKSPEPKEDTSLSRADLIALDSPFIAEPPSTVVNAAKTPDDGFESHWKEMHDSSLRGWCSASLETVLERLRSMQRTIQVVSADQLPFQGDVKVLIRSEPPEGDARAALRLKEGEDDSCLWHLRCQDDALRKSIRALLVDT